MKTREQLVEIATLLPAAIAKEFGEPTINWELWVTHYLELLLEERRKAFIKNRLGDLCSQNLTEIIEIIANATKIRPEDVEKETKPRGRGRKA